MYVIQSTRVVQSTVSTIEKSKLKYWNFSEDKMKDQDKTEKDRRNISRRSGDYQYLKQLKIHHDMTDNKMMYEVHGQNLDNLCNESPLKIFYIDNSSAFYWKNEEIGSHNNNSFLKNNKDGSLDNSLFPNNIKNSIEVFTDKENDQKFTKSELSVLQAVQNNFEEQSQSVEETQAKELSFDFEEEKADAEKIVDEVEEISPEGLYTFISEVVKKETVGLDDLGEKEEDLHFHSYQESLCCGQNCAEASNFEGGEFVSKEIIEICKEKEEYNFGEKDKDVKQEPQRKFHVIDASGSTAECVSLETDSARETKDMDCVTSYVILQDNDDELLQAELDILSPSLDSLNDANCPRTDLHLSLSYLAYSKQKETTEPMVLPEVLPANMTNVLSSSASNEELEPTYISSCNDQVYQIQERFDSSDDNECDNGSPQVHCFYLNANREGAHDEIKLGDQLKKMPFSLDNRFLSALEEKKNNHCCEKKDNLYIRKNSQSKRLKRNGRQRRRRKPKKFDSASNPRRGLDGNSHHNDPSQGQDLNESDTKPGGSPYDKLLDDGHCLPKRKLMSYEWSSRKCMSGKQRSGGSRSNDNSNHNKGSPTKRNNNAGGDKSQGGGDKGGNSGDGDGGGDKRPRGYAMKPNILPNEGEGEKSDEENDSDSQGLEQDILYPPRPPNETGASGGVIDNPSDPSDPSEPALNSMADGAWARQETQNGDGAEHSAATVDQLCFLLGMANPGSNINVFDSVNPSFNLCFTRVIHQLDLATFDVDNLRNCHSCDIIMGLFRHLANSDEDHDQAQCNTCRQICTLVLHHIELCIGKIPPQTYRTSTDLCYKVCHTAIWDIAGLRDPNIMKMIVEYCSSILRTVPDDDNQLQLNDAGEQAENLPLLSLLENEFSLPRNDVPVAAVASAAVASAPTLESYGASGKIAAQTATAKEPSRGASSRQPLTRKPSNRRQPRNIQPSIPEETHSPSGDEISDDANVKDLPFSRPQGYATADKSSPAYYDNFPQRDDAMMRNGAWGYAASLPEGTINDVPQFNSFVDQPMGERGIGEVVYDTPNRLSLVAGYWQVKKEECEKNNQQTSQRREEGVILSSHKDKFKILKTRYQEGSQWQVLSNLGYGMYGKCLLAEDTTTRFQFCAKKITLMDYEANEVCLWADLKDIHIVQLYGAIRHGDIVYIFEEFIDGGNLGEVIIHQRELGQRLSHWTAINYFQQILRGLSYLHSRNILHEDIKAENILLRSNSPHIVLTDFGISRRLQGKVEMKNQWPKGTATHFSPEKATGEGHGFPADVWAAVCVLAYMMSGKLPWQRYLRNAGCLNYIIYMQPPPMGDLPVNIQGVVRDLIAQGFIKDPESRPSATELLRHQAFQILLGETPESFYSTLMTGLNSGDVSNARVSEREPSYVSRSEVAVQPMQSAPAAELLYSLSITPETSAPRLSEMLDSTAALQPEVIEPTPASHVLPPALPFTNSSNILHDAHSQGATASGVDAGYKLRQNESAIMTSSSSEQDKPLSSGHLLHLPRLQELLPDNEFKGYFEDTYNSRQNFDEVSTQNSNLIVYEPNHSVPDLIPNLSIFTGSLSLASTDQLPQFKLDSTPRRSENRKQDSPQDNAPYSHISHSSSLEELLSDENSLSGPNATKGACNPQGGIPRVIGRTGEGADLMALADPIDELDKRSDMVTYQQNIRRKKPHNLTLDVSGQVHGQPSQDGAYNFLDDKREEASSNVTTGTSSSHLYEQQEKEYKDLMSSQSSENGNFPGIFLGNNGHLNDSDNEEETLPFSGGGHNLEDLEAAKLIDGAPFEGTKVSFWNKANEELFSFIFFKFPVALYHHIGEVIREVHKHGYRHFELKQMDGGKIKYSAPLEWEQVRVIAIEPGDPCNCLGCRRT